MVTLGKASYPDLSNMRPVQAPYPKAFNVDNHMVEFQPSEGGSIPQWEV